MTIEIVFCDQDYALAAQCKFPPDESGLGPTPLASRLAHTDLDDQDSIGASFSCPT